MHYYVKHDGEIVQGPFESRDEAREAANDKAERELAEDSEADFPWHFHVVPEWSYLEDPEGWHAFHHAEKPRSLFIEEGSDGYHAGVYLPDEAGEVVTATWHCNSFGEAIAALLYHAVHDV